MAASARTNSRRAHAGGTVVTVEGHRITLTNLDKVMYPETGTTKADVLDYYSRVTEALIPHIRDRPVTRKRWVHGVGTADDPGQSFFQKNLDEHAPEWITRRTIEHSDHANDYPVVNDRATITWLTQIAALELHVPQWRFSRTGKRQNPDRLVFDFDPGDGVGLPECAEAARLTRDILTGMGLSPMPVTSGSTGIHLYAGLDGTQTAEQVSAVAHELARALEADHPDLVVSDMKKSLRVGKVLLDWSQNNGNKTTIAPYSLRGRLRPMVAAPRTWRELGSSKLAQLDFRQVLDRLSKKPDPLAAIEADMGAFLEPTAGRMAGCATSPESLDRLEKYHSMRDATKTPEPFSRVAPAETGGNSFVIQEHHARRLHWDFRLEHEGVLVSWALPKGVPAESAHNHLAVQTEDHPLQYGMFEGSIPAGEYGAGDVTIWDSGTYDLEKWRDGSEVIATLHGQKHGSHRYALIHTGARGDDATGANKWLIHLMADDSGTAAAAAAAPAVKTSGAAKTAKRGKIAQPGNTSESAKTSEPARPTEPAVKPARARRIVGSTRRTSAIQPMLATLGTVESLSAAIDLATDHEWVFEMKWDGIRAIATVRGGEVTLESRNGVDLTASYPELAELAHAVGAHAGAGDTGAAPEVGGDVVLDGEIVALGRGGRPDFSKLQTRMNLTKSAEIAGARKSAPVQLLVFDLIVDGGRSLGREPWTARRQRLMALVTETASVKVPPVFGHDLGAAMTASRELGLEGVVAKRVDSTYLPGRRGTAWVKVKHHLSQSVVIGGWRVGRGARAGRVGSLLLGIPDAEGGGLRYVGRVGTGFSDAELDRMQRRLARSIRKSSPFHEGAIPDAANSIWVSPRLVGEVEFAEWTGEHPGEGRLRQPSWRGLRPDIAPGDVAVEEPPRHVR